MNEKVCKVNKAINHTDDEVKELNESEIEDTMMHLEIVVPKAIAQMVRDGNVREKDVEDFVMNQLNDESIGAQYIEYEDVDVVAIEMGDKAFRAASAAFDWTDFPYDNPFSDDEYDNGDMERIATKNIMPVSDEDVPDMPEYEFSLFNDDWPDIDDENVKDVNRLFDDEEPDDEEDEEDLFEPYSSDPEYADDYGIPVKMSDIILRGLKDGVITKDRIVKKAWSASWPNENVKDIVYCDKANSLLFIIFGDALVEDVHLSKYFLDDLEQEVLDRGGYDADKFTHKYEDLDYDKLREELEDNEEEVECQVCYNLVPKEDAIKTDGGYYICKDCYNKNQNDLEEGYGPKVKKGDKIKIINMKGEPQYAGKEGVVQDIDGIGQIHGTWGGCALIPEEDDFIVLNESKKHLKEALEVPTGLDDDDWFD